MRERRSHTSFFSTTPLGASDNFIYKRVADELQTEGRGSAEQISLATTKAEANIDGKAVTDIDICGKMYH